MPMGINLEPPKSAQQHCPVQGAAEGRPPLSVVGRVIVWVSKLRVLI